MHPKYYVVEFRFPLKIEEAKNEKDAAEQAAKLCEEKFGIKPDLWYTRVFQYSDDEGIGIEAEYFCNPQGTHFRKIDKNLEKHEKLLEKEYEQE